MGQGPWAGQPQSVAYQLGWQKKETGPRAQLVLNFSQMQIKRAQSQSHGKGLAPRLPRGWARASVFLLRLFMVCLRGPRRSSLLNAASIIRHVTAVGQKFATGPGLAHLAPPIWAHWAHWALGPLGPRARLGPGSVPRAHWAQGQFGPRAHLRPEPVRAQGPFGPLGPANF